MEERLGIAGSGAIACGLATVASRHGEVVMWVRSGASQERARALVEKGCVKAAEGADPERVRYVTEAGDLAEVTFAVEAVVEEAGAKGRVLGELDAALDAEAILATTTSSLSVEALAAASGRPARFVGLHVFNPVPRLELVELAFPAAARPEARDRARALCEALGKTAVEVPDLPGFVVNRLLFPYLFSAVRLQEQTGMRPEDIDTCMRLGAAHPLGPLALLDLVGLDVAAAIGEAIGEEVPAGIRERIARGDLGRKTGRGFHPG